MNLITDNNFLTDKNINFINQGVLSNKFPYFLTESTDFSEKIFSHQVVKAPEARQPGEFINSNAYEECLDILLNFIKNNNLEFNELLRCAINISYHQKKETCEIHRDHDYDHKQLLVYINDCIDKECATIIMDQKSEKILHKIYPEKHKGACFDSAPHYHFFPKKGLRAVIVYTFR
jgi:hypothetical protein